MKFLYGFVGLWLAFKWGYGAWFAYETGLMPTGMDLRGRLTFSVHHPEWRESDRLDLSVTAPFRVSDIYRMTSGTPGTGDWQEWLQLGAPDDAGHSLAVGAWYGGGKVSPVNLSRVVRMLALDVRNTGPTVVRRTEIGSFHIAPFRYHGEAGEKSCQVFVSNDNTAGAFLRGYSCARNGSSSDDESLMTLLASLRAPRHGLLPSRSSS